MRTVAFILLGALFVMQTPAEAATRSDADRAMSAFIAAFWDPSKKYFYTYSDHQIHPEHAVGPENGKYTDFWWEAQLWDLVMDAYDRTRAKPYRKMIDDVYDGFVSYHPAFANDYNDDMGWWAKASLRAYQITGKRRYLATAEQIFERIWKYQDSTYGGGIWWRNDVQDQKNVATNAPAAVTAAGLYQATGRRDYLTRARTLYDWIKANLHVDGHVYDHLEGQGKLVKWDFTYNFGTFISAGMALHEATGDPAYLADADRTAAWATANLTNGGTLLHEGIGDGGGFKPMLVRALTRLSIRYGRPYLKLLQRNATQAWNHRRADHLMGPDWSAPAPETPLQSLTAAAPVALLQVVPPDGHTGAQPETGVYEAENAIREGVGSESDHPGYSGRGYVAGWNSSGQAVTFHVNVVRGSYDLAFRYAAGAGDAGRRVLVNGSATDLAFPSAGDWSAWATTALPGVSLREGYNTIRVELGSGNYLNLDQLALQRS